MGTLGLVVKEKEKVEEGLGVEREGESPVGERVGGGSSCW